MILHWYYFLNFIVNYIVNMLSESWIEYNADGYPKTIKDVGVAVSGRSSAYPTLIAFTLLQVATISPRSYPGPTVK